VRRTLAALLLVTACSSSTPPTADPPPAADPSPAGVTVVATGLDTPWSLVFLPGGDALVSERDAARVLRIPTGGGAPSEVMRLPQTRPDGEGGLLGLAISPTYDDDGLVYAYLTAADDNRIVRFRLGGAVEPVLTGIPKGTIHNGGRIAFGPDGYLYVGTGDTGNRSLAQDPDSLGGKVLRLRPDGPAEVFSTGHRNVQGLAFDEKGQLYATEFGQNTFDEVNRVQQADNGGWPEVEGRGTGGGRFAEPLVTWETSEASPSGAAYLGGSVYVAALRGERLWKVPVAGGAPVPLLRGQYGRLRSVTVAPDGSLWLTTSNRDGRGDPVRDDDRVLRLAAG
jgi:glucose/arabinose dehydrogenase